MPRTQTDVEASISFNQSEIDVIIEAAGFFESNKEFTTDEEFAEWRETVRKLTDLIKDYQL